MAKVAFIGLGVMGYPMAGHLARAGHDVTVWNRTAAKAQQWAGEYTGTAADTVAAACAGAVAVFVCVGNDSDVRAVIGGADGVIASVPAGCVVVDHTTASADVARDMAALAAGAGVGFVDAPVSGGEAGAQNGVLTVMCGGAQADFDAVAPVMDAYARSCRLMGPVGSGQLTKMVNQIAIAGVLQGLSEAVNFGQKAGLDMSQVLEVISKGAAQSWQMENRGGTMCDRTFDFGFALDWMIKDLDICLEEARRNGALLPVTAHIEQLYRQLSQMGKGRQDTSSLIELLDVKQ